MAYGPPPSPGQGQQPGWQQPQPQQQQNLWQQPPPQQRQPGSAWQQQPQPPGSSAWQQPPQQPDSSAWQQPSQGRGTTPMPGHFGPVSDDDKTWSLMAYLGQFLVGAIAPGVVYLGKARSPFVRRHAAQGLNIGIAAIAVWIVGGLLSLAVGMLIWVPLIFTAVVLFFLVYAARAANRGEFRRVPPVVAWPIIKK